MGSRLSLALTGAILMLVCTPVRAAPGLQTFHIDAGDAARTLNEFSLQSSLQLLFDYTLVTGRTTHGVSGEMPAVVAIQRMLEGTGLRFDYVNDHTLSIAALDPDVQTGAAVATAPPAGNARTRAGQKQDVERDRPGSAAARDEWRTAEPQEIVVTGTHLRGGQPVGDRVISAGRNSIEASGAATVQDFLRTLPQTFGGGPTEDTHYFSSETQTNPGLGSGINLRGLGARATLVLINGKRLAPGVSEAAFADIESIPLSAVDRIDILPDSASAMYGADAVGGVVNLLMRDNFSGAESLARGGSGTRNTQREYQLAQTLGSDWDSGNGMLSVEYYWRDAKPTFDTQLRYELAPFGPGLLSDTRLELNASNVFNRSPPFLNNAVARIGYDQENADPYGRLVSLQVRKAW